MASAALYSTGLPHPVPRSVSPDPPPAWNPSFHISKDSLTLSGSEYGGPVDSLPLHPGHLKDPGRETGSELPAV